MLILTQALLEAIEAHGRASYPYEGCGLLLGVTGEGVNEVLEIRPMANVWPVEEEKRERFRLDEREWIAAEMQAAMAGLDIVGIFHSHPDCEPVASPRDLAWASWPGYSYLITRVDSEEIGQSRSWQLNEAYTNFVEEGVTLAELN